MIKLNLFAISGICIIIATLPNIIILTIFGKNKLARITNFELLSIFGWGIGSFLIGSLQNQSAVDSIWKFAYVAVLFIPVFFLHLVYILLEVRSKVLVYLAYLQAAIFSGLTFFGLMFPQPSIYIFDSFYFHCNSKLYAASFITWLLIACFSHGILLANYKKVFEYRSALLKFFLLSLPLGFGGGTLNFLPGFGIYLYPYGNFLIPAYCILLAYTILNNEQYEIKNINRGITYSILLFSVSFAYFICIIYLERKFKTVLSYHSFYASAAIAFVLGMIFMPLRYRIQEILDNFFYNCSYQDIAQQNQKLLEKVAQSEKYRTLATLASGIAHEIRNPLTIIKTFTEFLPQKHQDVEFVRKYSSLTSKEVERIEELVSQLMSYSKPNPPKFEATCIKKLLEHSLDVLSNQMLSRKIRCTRQINLNADLHLNVDGNQIHQVVFNIILNAIEAMPNGGELVVEATLEQDQVVLCFRDNGPGIEPDHLQQIFDPFFTQKDFGTGLGLAIVQSIIENHHGQIIARSQLGKGTEIRIELPTI